MGHTYNIYCDESCNLEHDGHRVMVLGAIWCPLDRVREISSNLRRLKERHGLARSFEVKWTKVSPAKLDFYRQWMQYFFAVTDLHFRVLIVPNKEKLNHAAFPGQDHDQWYYKIYFGLLQVIFSPGMKYRIYIDIKDTRGAKKQKKLHDVLCNNQYDFQREIIERVQQIRSHESEVMQLADLLIGAVCYANRGLSGNAGKEALVVCMREESHYSLTQTTLLRENKVNIFRWQAQEVHG